MSKHSLPIAALTGLMLQTAVSAPETRLPRLSPRPETIGGQPAAPVSLNGSWKFSPMPGTGFWKQPVSASWADIQVPGEWAMQSFDVPKDNFAGYMRTFTAPAEMKGQRLKLRFGAVYSECRVYLNGEKVGEHLGGFTPFELDVTDAAKIGGENVLALEVRNESLADSLASGTKYACHPLGGISRNAELFALPGLNIADCYATTTFDETFTDAVLHLQIKVANEGTKKQTDAQLQFTLAPWKGSEKTVLVPDTIAVPELQAGEVKEIKVDIPVAAPRKWDCERPNLYALETALSTGDQSLETIRQRIGFREVKTEGNELFVNGKPVKLRGICRHEVHPTAGRAYVPGLARKDVELFREANVNHIRTSHYPSSEELVEAADELGIFIEMEGPFCWAHRTKGDNKINKAVAISQTLEMLVRDRSNPSVIIWSIANESNAAWERYFPEVTQIVEQVDPTRSRIFNWMGGKIKTQTEDYCDIATIHYPGMGSIQGIEAYGKRPVYYGEFAHLNAYNRFELATDQGLRATWGKYLSRSWEAIYATKGALGGSIWAAIDDTFYWDFKLPDESIEKRTVGYGTWGPIDGWRRKKPEWWGMKKVYSPIRILTKNPKAADGKVILEIENRQDFSNLNRLQIRWECGSRAGSATADIPPHSKGSLVVDLKEARGDSLDLTFTDPRGFMTDRFSLPLRTTMPTVAGSPQGTYKVSENDNTITISGKDTAYVIDRKTGLFTTARKKRESFPLAGPHLMILPLNPEGGQQMEGIDKAYAPFTETCSDWNAGEVEVSEKPGTVQVTVQGAYKEAGGRYVYTFNSDGTIEVEYDFKSTAKVQPRQLGIVFDLPAGFDTLSWKRKGLWSTYPDWHITRLEGTVKATEGFAATLTGPRTEPDHPWRLDRSTLGNNDFCSTKPNVYTASLNNESGAGMQVIANADRHTRSWVVDDKVRLLIASYSNGGAGKFLKKLSSIDYITLKNGDVISGNAKLQLIADPKRN